MGNAEAIIETVIIQIGPTGVVDAEHKHRNVTAAGLLPGLELNPPTLGNPF